MYTPKAERRDTPRVDELLRAAKVSVIFIDDEAWCRPDEIGSVQYIREAAERNDCTVLEYQLEAQFRCAGSDGFVNWVNNTLGIRKTANILWQGNEGFDFRIFSSPEELEAAIRRKASEGHSARMTRRVLLSMALPLRRSSWMIPNRRDCRHGTQTRREEAPKGISQGQLWAHDPNGNDQSAAL
jgi:hypothetical protein